MHKVTLHIHITVNTVYLIYIYIDVDGIYNFSRRNSKNKLSTILHRHQAAPHSSKLPLTTLTLTRYQENKIIPAHLWNDPVNLNSYTKTTNLYFETSLNSPSTEEGMGKTNGKKHQTAIKCACAILSKPITGGQSSQCIEGIINQQRQFTPLLLFRTLEKTKELKGERTLQNKIESLQGQSRVTRLMARVAI